MSSKEYFDRVADHWDRMRTDFFSETVREKAYQVAGVVEGKTAADLGAGTGFITEGLLDRGVKVIAVDQSEAMLKTLRERLHHPDNLRCLTGEAAALPVEDESVDFSFANMYLHHVESPAKAIREMVRILKPGGRLVITDLAEHEFAFLLSEHHDRWLGFKRAALQKWMEEAGLINTTIDCTGEECCATSCCTSDEAKIRILVAWGDKQA